MELEPGQEAKPDSSTFSDGSLAADPAVVATWLRLATEATPTDYFVWTAATDVVSWGFATGRSRFGRPSSENSIRLPRFLIETVYPDDVEILRQGLHSGLTDGRFVVAGRFRDAAGGFRWSEWRGQAIPSPDGRPDRVAGIVSIRTDRSQDSAIDAYQRLAVDSVPALISYIDRDFRYVSVNETYRTWFGQDPQALVGMLVADVIGPDASNRLKPYMERALAGERQRFDGELPYQWGGTRAVQLNYTPDQPDATGLIPGFVVLAFDISELKRLESLAKAGEERWRGLFETMAEGFSLAELLFDPESGRAVDFRFLELNPAFETLTGLPIGSTVGRTARDVISQVEDELIQTYARVVATGVTERFEIFLPSLDEQWFEATARHVEGRTFSVMFNQITTRKRAEAEIRERERRQTALLILGDRLRDLKTVEAITSTAMEILGRTLGVIRAGYGRFETDQESLIIDHDWHTEAVGSLVGHHQLADYGRLGEELRNHRTVIVNDTATDPITASEVARWQILQIRAVINIPIVEAGTLAAMLFIQSDVPRIWASAELLFVREVAERTWATVERARVAEELASSEERFRQIANVAPQVLWTADPDGTLDYVSDQHFLNTGIDKASSSPADWIGVIHPDDVAQSVECWGQAIQSGELYEVQQRIRDASSGGYRWHLTRALPTRDPVGNITKWLGSNTDIDDQKRSEGEVAQALDAAEAANRMKDEFLATLSHELRTPLNAIVGWAKILQGEGVDAEDLGEGLNAIERNGQVQSRLIEDLLDVSRIVSGNLRLDVVPVDLTQAIEAAIGVVTPAAQAKQIRILARMDRQLGPISGDFARLQQIFWNLITNAVKFTPKGGVVQVALDRVESHVQVRVVDSGIGIKPEFLPHVFDRFRQADGSTTRRHGGLGLGLAIVKHLVEMHGGSIHASSPGIDQGSTFVVILPITAVLDNDPAPKPVPQEPESVVATSADRPSLAGVRVLVVDDEPDARQMIRRVLVDCRAEVVLASSGAEAREQVTQYRPEIILSDIGMPDEDGYDFIRRVRTDHPGWNVPAIALTAFARSEDRTKALLAGFQVHLTKPVDPDELIATVAALTGRIEPIR